MHPLGDPAAYFCWVQAEQDCFELVAIYQVVQAFQAVLEGEIIGAGGTEG